MDPRLGHVLALLLGITLTVGFYEGRRLVFNTMKAVQAANAELRGSGGGGGAGAKKSEKKKGKKKASKGDGEALAADAPRKGNAKKGGNKKGGAKGKSKKEVMRERLRAKLAEMSPEERDALKERVQERRDARKMDLQARRDALRERRAERMAELGLTRDGDLPPEEGFGELEDDFDPNAPVAEDELLDALEEDLPPLEDTGFPAE